METLQELSAFIAENGLAFAGQDANGFYFSAPSKSNQRNEWNVAPYFDEYGVAGVLVIHYRDGFTTDGVPTRTLIDSFFIPVTIGVSNTGELANMLGV